MLAPTVNDRSLSCGPRPSSQRTRNVQVPAHDGVPLMIPAGLRVSPSGSVQPASDHCKPARHSLLAERLAL